MKLTENSVLNVMKTTAELYCHLYPMNAIWLEDKLTVVRDNRAVPTARLALTDCVKVIDGVIVDALNGNDATHEVVVIKGTNRQSNNEFVLSGRTISTDEIETIKLS